MRPDLWIVGENVPDVRECFGHPVKRHPSQADLTRSQCDQCNGSHDHDWVSCATIFAGGGIPVRCHVCGARKCDTLGCIERRHHRGPHLAHDRVLGPVGI